MSVVGHEKEVSQTQFCTQHMDHEAEGSQILALIEQLTS